VAGWTKPVAEAEIAVHVSRDVPAAAGRAEAAEAIGALGAAVELADVDFPPDDVTAILASNIYHRAVVLGPPSEAGAGGAVAGLSPRLLVNGEEAGSTDEPEALTGELIDLVRHLAGLLAACGEELRAGDVLIAGAVLPPLDVAPGDALRFELGRLGAVEVTIAA
jgi:2-keto-4-pentenoate hydratase